MFTESGLYHAHELPQGLFRRHLSEVAGAERQAHQHVPEALHTAERVAAAGFLPVELQLTEDLARRLLTGQLGEVRRAKADAAEDIPEGLRARSAYRFLAAWRWARRPGGAACRMPTPDEARELELAPGVPVFRVLRTVYDTEGRPLEVQDSVAAADRHQFRYEVEMR